MSAIEPLNMRQSTYFITITISLPLPYDKVSANGPFSVPNTSEFQSSHREAKKFETPETMYIYDI